MANAIRYAHNYLLELGYILGVLVFQFIALAVLLIGACGAWGLILLSVINIILGGHPYITNPTSFLIVIVVGITSAYIGFGMIEAENFKSYEEYKKDKIQK